MTVVKAKLRPCGANNMLTLKTASCDQGKIWSNWTEDNEGFSFNYSSKFRLTYQTQAVSIFYLFCIIEGEFTVVILLVSLQ